MLKEVEVDQEAEEVVVVVGFLQEVAAVQEVEVDSAEAEEEEEEALEEEVVFVGADVSFSLKFL